MWVWGEGEKRETTAVTTKGCSSAGGGGGGGGGGGCVRKWRDRPRKKQAVSSLGICKKLSPAFWLGVVHCSSRPRPPGQAPPTQACVICVERAVCQVLWGVGDGGGCLTGDLSECITSARWGSWWCLRRLLPWREERCAGSPSAYPSPRPLPRPAFSHHVGNKKRGRRGGWCMVERGWRETRISDEQGSEGEERRAWRAR